MYSTVLSRYRSLFFRKWEFTCFLEIHLEFMYAELHSRWTFVLKLFFSKLTPSNVAQVRCSHLLSYTKSTRIYNLRLPFDLSLKLCWPYHSTYLNLRLWNMGLWRPVDYWTWPSRVFKKCIQTSKKVPLIHVICRDRQIPIVNCRKIQSYWCLV